MYSSHDPHGQQLQGQTALLFLSLFYNSAYAAGDAENIKLLSSFKKTGGGAGEVIPQNTKITEDVEIELIIVSSGG